MLESESCLCVSAVYIPVWVAFIQTWSMVFTHTHTQLSWCVCTNSKNIPELPLALIGSCQSNLDTALTMWLWGRRVSLLSISEWVQLLEAALSLNPLNTISDEWSEEPRGLHCWRTWGLWLSLHFLMLILVYRRLQTMAGVWFLELRSPFTKCCN